MASSRGRPELPAPLAGPRGWWAVAAVWAAMGLLESGKAYVMTRAVGQPASARFVLVGNLPWWLLWGALTPAVFALCRRRGFFPGERWGRALAVHVPAALLFAVLHLGVTALVYHRTNAPDADLGRMWTLWLNNFLFLELFTYASIVAAYHALVHYRLYRERQEAAARLELEQERLGREMARAKLQALQMELQPHFLFNTFNAITALVRRNENRAAVEMLVRLSELLRQTLERGGTPLVTLAEEVELARAYLGIQQVRFPGLEVEIAVEARAGRALVPTLVLQPLVENAVRHGLAGRGEGRVRVRGTLAGDRLRIEVEDTGGAGAQRSAPAGGGVGLGNTRARLEQLWGDEARLALEPADGGGTRVVMEIPHTARSEGEIPAGAEGGAAARGATALDDTADPPTDPNDRGTADPPAAPDDRAATDPATASAAPDLTAARAASGDHT